jgi:prophage tail gpP-like protein
MSDDELHLVVEGRRYAGWKSVRVTRSIEGIAGAFALDASDRWGADAPWPILEEDACRVEIGGEVVIDGYIDKRSLSASKDSRSLSYEGRDRAGALADCSAILGKWTVYNVDVSSFAAKVAEPFGVGVSVQPGLKLERVPKVTFSPGDTALDVIRRVAEDEGVLLVSDGAGGIVITRSGTTRVSALIEGVNILTASSEFDAKDRFQHYVVSSQVAGTDDAFGDATRSLDGASDAGVRRAERVLFLHPEHGYSIKDTKRRAQWEAITRAARAVQVTVTVRGWKQADGKLWSINTLTHVSAPNQIGIEGDMLISQVEYSVGEVGKVTQLSLVRPDAYTPPPRPVVRGAKSGYGELANGAKPGALVRQSNGFYTRVGGIPHGASLDPELVQKNLAVLLAKLKGRA